jgi:hypothetical protein
MPGNRWWKRMMLHSSLPTRSGEKSREIGAHLMASKCSVSMPTLCSVGPCMETSRCPRGRRREGDLVVVGHQNYGGNNILRESTNRGAKTVGSPRDCWKS